MNLSLISRFRKPNFFAIAAVVLFCVVWFVKVEWPMLTNEYWLNDDNAQHVAWMWKWRSGHQFAEGDMMNHAAQQLQQWGYLAVARLAMLVMDPLQFSKFMPLTTLLATCFFSFFLFKKRFGNLVGVAVAVLIGTLTFERMVGFNGRAFGYPLMVAFVYFLADGKWRGVATSLIISALFYPTVLLISLGMLGVEGMRLAFVHRKKLRPTVSTKWKTVAMLGICAAVGLAIPAIKSKQIAADPNLGAIYPAEELMSLPMFEAGKGRVDFHEEMRPLSKTIESLFLRPQNMLPLMAVCLVLFLATARPTPPCRRFDWAILSLPVVGIGLMLVAQWRLPDLFLPSRFVTYSYPVFLAFLLMRTVGAVEDFVKKKWLGIALAALLVLPKFINWDKSGKAQQDYGNYAWLFKRVNELPPDHGLIAGPLLACDMVPMKCRRSVLFSFEGFHALYFERYWEKMSVAYYAYLDALTTSDIKVVEDFVKKYGVDYLIVDLAFVERGEHVWNFKPFYDYFSKRKEANPDRQYALNQLSAEFYIKVDDNYRILDCRKWLGQ